MTDLDRRPSRFGAALAAGAGLVAVAGLAAFRPVAGLVAGVGLVALVAGVVVSSRRLVTAWLVLAWLGAVVGATGPLPPAATGLVVLGAVVAWDAGQRAVGLGRALTRPAATARAETVHASATAAVGAATLGVAYGVYALAGGLRPGLAPLSLAVAVVALLVVLDRETGSD